MFLKPRPAVGLLCFAVIVVAGYGIFTELSPDPTVTVLIWSSPETETVIQPALDLFNTSGYTVAVNGGNYRVRASSVTVESSEIYSRMVAALNTGKESLSSTEGRPTAVSPSTSSWLSQINLDTGQQVFRMDIIRPIARTPVIIVTCWGLAECLGWPDNPVSWSDLIELAESVQGWSACPTARPEWGEKPLVVLGEPEVNSAARSTLQILNVVAAGKPAEDLTVWDVDSLEVREFVDRFEGIVDHFYSYVGDIRRQLHEGPSTVHFALVEERHIPKIYSDQPSGDPNPELVAIYPSDGTIWNDNPFAIPDAPWVTTEQREAAPVVRDYLRGENVQRQFMEDGFRAGVY
jgi:Ca-activated chloride channel family protein